MAGTSCGENELWRERVEARAKCGESQPTGDDLRQYQKLAMTGEGENELRRERVAARTSCDELRREPVWNWGWSCFNTKCRQRLARAYEKILDIHFL